MDLQQMKGEIKYSLRVSKKLLSFQLEKNRFFYFIQTLASVGFNYVYIFKL